MEKEKKLNFDFPKMDFSDEALKKKENNQDKETDETVLKDSAIEDKGFAEEIRSAMESGRESGEVLSEKTNIDGTHISEVYKGMGMAAGLTIGIGKIAKTMSEKVGVKISEKIKELDEKNKI
ncbi:MAG: hypothetical protein DRG24_02505 [Epsilonproteobacteria bacterium]|nr:MAG: hypothetical protein DRG24_02505 [Campylobacterota bacterium]